MSRLCWEREDYEERWEIIHHIAEQIKEYKETPPTSVVWEHPNTLHSKYECYIILRELWPHPVYLEYLEPLDSDIQMLPSWKFHVHTADTTKPYIIFRMCSDFNVPPCGLGGLKIEYYKTEGDMNYGLSYEKFGGFATPEWVYNPEDNTYSKDYPLNIGVMPHMDRLPIGFPPKLKITITAEQYENKDKPLTNEDFKQPKKKRKTH